MKYQGFWKDCIFNYNLSYWVGLNKKTKYFVKCIEDINDTFYNITFLYGTAMLNKGKKVKDAFSCTFNNNGKYFFNKVEWNEHNLNSLEHFVTIATKRAECKKLNQVEKSLIKDSNNNVFFDFTKFLLFFGTFFAVGFTVAFFIFVCLLGVTIEKDFTFVEICKTYPWAYIFLFCFIAYGGIMAIIEVLARKK